MVKVFLKKAFWNHYDHLGSLIPLNLLWMGVGLPWTFLGGVLVLTGGTAWAQGRAEGIVWILAGLDLLWVSPPTAALFSVVRGYVAYRPERVGRWFGALRRHFWRAQALGIAVALGTGVMGLGVGVYLRWGVVGMLLAGVLFWTLWLWNIAALFLPAVLAFQNPPFVDAFRSSIGLVGGNPKFSIPFSLGVLLWSTLTGMTGIGLVVFGPASASMWVATAFREMTDPEASPDEELRGWRDIVRPWEG
ncbi:MAG TPA: DUF624 domain-containing protein [Candidatus Latescibacteria bacterium]|nr:DUF624 domain-containing protein [Candidatus Latescibacterota bacterium]